ncbi:AcrVA2 family anti-CRISPR protein [Rhodoferax ferrireducens]|nr:hypothetical protein [Rhodoferax ferrireducens]
MSAILESYTRHKYTYDEAIRIQNSDSKLGTALCAWRMTKGVYHFDDEMLKELCSSSLKDEVATEFLFRMPEWGVYISTPGLDLHEGFRMHGFFAVVDDEGSDRGLFAPVLRIEVIVDPRGCNDSNLLMLLSMDPDLIMEAEEKMEADHSLTALDVIPRDKEYLRFSISVPLIGKTISESLEISEREKAAQRAKHEKVRNNLVPIDSKSQGYLASAEIVEEHFSPELDDETKQFIVNTNLLLINILMYICSDEPDIQGGTIGERKASVVKAEKEKKKVYSADRVTEWNVGFRIGADLRKAKEDWEKESASDGNGPKMRPHFRKSHWHMYWTGPKDKPQKHCFKWLWPIPVNVNKADDVITTAHLVSSGIYGRST